MQIDTEYPIFSDDIYPAPYANKASNFAVSASISIFRVLPKKRFLGLFQTQQKIDLPEIPKDAILSTVTFADTDSITKALSVSSGFLETTAGKTFLIAYCQALASHSQANALLYTPEFCKQFFNWDFRIGIPEKAAEYGFIDLWAFEAYGFERLERTASALRQPIRDEQTLVLNDESLEDSGDALVAKYVSLADYMAVTKTQVLIRALDFDAEDEEAAKVLHQFILDKQEFSREFTRTAEALKRQLTQICNAIQASPSIINDNNWQGVE
jgi:uncharacterized protein YfkK (UPF0435 family)